MSLDALGRSAVLQGLLTEANIPFTSVQVVDINATPPNVVIQYSPSATAEQIALGNQIRDGFDWRRRRALDRNTVVTALNQLTTQQQNALIRHLVCEQLRTNPALATKVNAALGTALTVDEVDPN